MIGKVDLQVVEQHAQCCEMSENQIVFHKGYYFLKGTWRGNYTLLHISDLN